MKNKTILSERFISEGLKERLKDGVYNKELEYLGNEFVPFLKFGETVYLVKNGRVCWIHHYSRQIRMVELTNSNAVGKICKVVVLELPYDADNYLDSQDVITFFKSDVWKSNNFWATFDLFYDDALDTRNGVDVGVLKVFSYNRKGVDTFSIFGNYKEVTSRPPAEKLQKVHLIGMLMNNQVTSFLKGKYTDDYARDAADNYSRGVAKNYEVAKQLHSGDTQSNFFYYEKDNPNEISLSTVHGMYDYTLNITDPKLMV